MSPRTRLQIEADRFDADLYRLLLRAELHADDKSYRSTDRESWDHMATALANARHYVRAMMHPRDREIAG